MIITRLTYELFFVSRESFKVWCEIHFRQIFLYQFNRCQFHEKSLDSTSLLVESIMLRNFGCVRIRVGQNVFFLRSYTFKHGTSMQLNPNKNFYLANISLQDDMFGALWASCRIFLNLSRTSIIKFGTKLTVLQTYHLEEKCSQDKNFCLVSIASLYHVWTCMNVKNTFWPTLILTQPKFLNIMS